MAHLITNHDPYHIHKVLGLLVLLHYLYRFYLLFSTGHIFPPYEPTWQSICGVLLHGLLSWSSLLLPLPKTRNFSKPMIWPEFRFHSILFASRHILTTLLTLANLWPREDEGVANVLANGLLRAGVILGTVKLASVITDKHGDRSIRTTNAMPYPTNVSDEQQLAIKQLYTSAQSGATVTSLTADPSMTFGPLLGIQMAPLLMTLVRKGKIATGTYHRVYAISLSLGYVVTFVRLLDGADADGVAHTLRALVLYNLPFKRIRQYVSARAFWTVTITFATIVYPLFVKDFITEENNFVSKNSLKAMIWFGVIKTMVNQMITYAPLFNIGTATSDDSSKSKKRKDETYGSDDDGGKQSCSSYDVFYKVAQIISFNS